MSDSTPLEPPSGEVAFLFTDLQGSTSAWEREPVAMNDVLARHDEALRAAIAAHDGAMFSVAGDAFGAAFHTVDAAADCAVAAQLALTHQEWPSGLAPRVRMGLHVGRAFERDGNYFGPTPNRAARIMSVAHGGQILLSDEAAQRLSPHEAIGVELLGRNTERLHGPVGDHDVLAWIEVERHLGAQATNDGFAQTEQATRGRALGCLRRLDRRRDDMRW